MRRKTILAWTLALAVLAIPGCEKPLATIPVTTSSETARESYLQGRAVQDSLRTIEARPFFEHAVKEDPEFALAHLALAGTSTTSGEFYDALRRAVSLVHKVSEGEKRLILGFDAGSRNDFERQLELYRELVRMYYDDERAQTVLGAALFGQNRYAEAANHFERAVELNPGHAPAYNLLGYSRRFTGALEAAEEAFQKYIDLVPSEPNPYDSYAELLMKMGRFEESIENYRKALSIDAGFSYSRIGIANNLMLLGRMNEARAELQQLLEGARSDGERREALRWTAISHVHEDAADQAVAAMRKSVELARQGGDLAAAAVDLSLIGDIELHADRRDAALQAYTQSLESMEQAQVPEEVKAAARRGYLYHQVLLLLADEDVDAARVKLGDYRRSMAEPMIPAEGWRVRYLGSRLSLLAGNPEVALRLLSHANRYDPRTLMLTAQIHRTAGHTDRARRVAESVVNFNELNANLAFVRAEAQRMLEEL